MDGYESVTDQYFFRNWEKRIDKSYYENMFDPLHVEFFYNLVRDGAGGHCYGMAATTALFLKGTPAINSVTSYTDTIAYETTNLKQMSVGSGENKVCLYNNPSYVNPFNLSLPDFIKYAHIMQHRDVFVQQEEDTANDYQKIIAAIKEYVNGGEPVILTVQYVEPIKLKTHEHSILPVGYEERDGQFVVFINDSNLPNTIQVLMFEYDSSNTKVVDWSYLGYNSDKHAAQIRYSQPCQSIYNFCVNTTNSRPSDAPVITSTSKLFVTNNIRNVITDSVTGEIFYDAANGIENNIREIVSSGGESVTENRLFWIDEQYNEFDISATDGDVEFALVDGYAGISATIEDGESVNCVVDDNENLCINLEDTKGDSLTFSFMVADDDNVAKINISGIAEEDNVRAIQTEDGFSVSGMENGEITLIKNDEIIDVQSVENAVSDIEIEYNGAKDDSMDVTYDTDNDTGSDSDDETDADAGADKNNCSHICHQSGFMGFIWMIARIFMMIFGINPVCECGAAHY